MAVSKRLRFEVLRRDNHTCRYCGRSAPDVKLTVDHVVAVTLGGSDDPSNLVAACADCNSGKSSLPADAPLVADVAADALRWAEAMESAAAIRSTVREHGEAMLNQFDAIWTKYWIPLDSEPDGRWHAPRPHDWRQSVRTFVNSGLDIPYFGATVRTVLYEKRQLNWESCWRYFCGMCWRELDHRREIAYSLLQTEGQ